MGRYHQLHPNATSDWDEYAANSYVQGESLASRRSIVEWSMLLPLQPMVTFRE